MAERKNFLLRIDPAVLNTIQQWAADDLRSLNGQIEFILRKALADSGRIRTVKPVDSQTATEASGESK